MQSEKVEPVEKEIEMNTFVNAVVNQEARTTNGMKARKSTASKCVDLFFKVGASRGKDITGDFVAAYVENKDIALRIAQWVRDARGGAGDVAGDLGAVALSQGRAAPAAPSLRRNRLGQRVDQRSPARLCGGRQRRGAPALRCG